ncbi:MAG: hypothetical protein ACPHRO_03165, partial [Nannocystaceae bacterium]
PSPIPAPAVIEEVATVAPESEETAESAPPDPVEAATAETDLGATEPEVPTTPPLPRADLSLSYGYRWGANYNLGNLAVQGNGRLGARRRLLAGIGLSWAAPSGRLDAQTGDDTDTGDDAIRVQQLEALALFGFQGGERGSSKAPASNAGVDRLTARLVLGIGAAVLFGRNELNGREDRTGVARVTLHPALAIWISRGLSIDLGGTLELSAPGVSVVGGVGSADRGVVAGGIRLALRWTWIPRPE